MDKGQLYHFLSQQKLAVISTVNNGNKPESALVGIAVTPGLEIIFDTVNTSRKYHNILRNPNVSLVIGWDNETTVQYEGIAAELTGAEAQRYKEVYFNTFPDARERAATWQGLAHFRVKPRWVRYSNFNAPAVIGDVTL